MRSLSSAKRRGVADGADEVGGQVVAAVDEVEDCGLQVSGFFVGGGVEQHAVDGEVAAEDVFSGEVEKRTASGRRPSE